MRNQQSQHPFGAQSHALIAGFRLVPVFRDQSVATNRNQLRRSENLYNCRFRSADSSVGAAFKRAITGCNLGARDAVLRGRDEKRQHVGTRRFRSYGTSYFPIHAAIKIPLLRSLKRPPRGPIKNRTRLTQKQKWRTRYNRRRRTATARFQASVTTSATPAARR
jgi:hypothetical protein